MNCIRCNESLPPGARFCGNCGALLPINDPIYDATAHSMSSQPNLPPTVPGPSFQQEQQIGQILQTRQTQQAQHSWTPARQAPQQKWVLPGPQVLQVPVIPETPPGTGFAGQAPQALASRQYARVPDIPQHSRRRGRGIGRRLRITLITLAVIIVVLVGAWIFGMRPYLHSLAEDQLDPALSSAVDQIDFSVLSQLPAGVPVRLRVTEDEINNFYLPLVHVPSSPVQNMQIQITANDLQLDFTVYGFSGDITGRPTLVNGNLMVTDVSVGGITGLVMSPDEMTTLLNKHLADVQARIQRPINEVLLLDHELDIVLG